MKSLRGVLLACLLFTACPGVDGKVDPYLTAHTVINQLGMAVPLAQGIFNQWLYTQTDAEKAKNANAVFQKVVTAVSNGFVVAHNGVDIAKQAKQDPDVAKLLEQADVAWKNLVKFLTDLLGPGDPGISVELVETPPSSQPAKKMVTISGKITKHPVSYLPTTLLPK